jgi:hypothetical protein
VSVTEEPIDLMDHDDVDRSGADLGKEQLQGRTVQRRTKSGRMRQPQCAFSSPLAHAFEKSCT